MIPRSNNDIERVTFDEFFIKKLYSSYLVGASNVYDRMIPDYVSYNEDTEQYHAEILKEQERIERELLNFEQDLWEY